MTKRHCPKCDADRDFSVRLEMDLSTLEHWETIACVVCHEIIERKLTEPPYTEVSPKESPE